MENLSGQGILAEPIKLLHVRLLPPAQVVENLLKVLGIKPIVASQGIGQGSAGKVVESSTVAAESVVLAVPVLQMGGFVVEAHKFRQHLQAGLWLKAELVVGDALLRQPFMVKEILAASEMVLPAFQARCHGHGVSASLRSQPAPWVAHQMHHLDGKGLAIGAASRPAQLFEPVQLFTCIDQGGDSLGPEAFQGKSIGIGDRDLFNAVQQFTSLKTTGLTEATGHRRMRSAKLSLKRSKVFTEMGSFGMSAEYIGQPGGTAAGFADDVDHLISRAQGLRLTGLLKKAAEAVVHAAQAAG